VIFRGLVAGGALKSRSREFKIPGISDVLEFLPSRRSPLDPRSAEDQPLARKNHAKGEATSLLRARSLQRSQISKDL
jgi:hypothetical protein